jgi:hypothetical protein
MVITCRDLHGDLPAELGPRRQSEIIPAPEPAGVIPVRPPGGQQAHGLVGDGDDFRAVGGFQGGVTRTPAERWQPPAQPSGGEPGRGRERRAIQLCDAAQQRVFHLA